MGRGFRLGLFDSGNYAIEEAQPTMKFDEMMAKLGLTVEDLTGAGLELEPLQKSLTDLPEESGDVLSATLDDPEVTALIKGDPSKVAALLHHLANHDDEEDDEDTEGDEEGSDDEGETDDDEGSDDEGSDDGGDEGEDEGGDEKEGADDDEVDALLKRYGIDGEDDEDDDTEKPEKLKKSVGETMAAELESVVPLDATTAALLKGFGEIMDEHFSLLHKRVSRMEKSLAAGLDPLQKGLGEGAVAPVPQPIRPSPGAIQAKMLEQPSGSSADAASAELSFDELLLKSIPTGKLTPAQSQTLRNRFAAGTLTDADNAKLEDLRKSLSEE